MMARKWLPALAVAHALLTWGLFQLWRQAPVLVVEMSSTAASRAQVYFDTGAGMNETQSELLPVPATADFQRLVFPLPNAVIRALRFDPLMAPGTVTIRRAEVWRSDGSLAISFAPEQIRGVMGFDQENRVPEGIRYRVRSDSNDPRLMLNYGAPLDLSSRRPGESVLTRIALANVLLLAVEALVFLLFRRGFALDLRAALAFGLHALLTIALLELSAEPPKLRVEMSSSVVSRAQVYWDAGAGMSEDQSESAPVYGTGKYETLEMPLPRARITALRFDPITSPGGIVIHRAEALRADGTVAAAFPPSHIRGILGFDQEESLPDGGVRYRVRSDSYDPELVLQLDSALDLRSRAPGLSALGRIVLANLALLALEALLLYWPPGRRGIVRLYRATDAAFERIAARLSAPGFITFDRFAIWVYAGSLALFLIFSAACFNGSSIGILWRNYKVGAPSHILAGAPQGIRADEIYYETPAILNQYFRAQRFEAKETALGPRNSALLGSTPVRHISTLFRPQYWPFFALPSGDFAFSAWWQAKWLIFVTGIFTLLLLFTGSSSVALIGALWMLFSEFTQWCWSWPSMLPEMAGLFCFTLVFGFYLLVGRRPAALLASAILCAACAINFALCAYVPHLIPYAWAAVFIGAAWCIANASRIGDPAARGWRIGAALLAVAIAGAMMGVCYADLRDAIAAIAATKYPGHRSLAGGEYWPTTMLSHFFAASETAARFPPQYTNICEASGFLWLAPATLLAWSAMRALSRERRILLAGLWAAALFLLAWMFLPIPAWLGHYFLLDRVMGVRVLPAIGFLNAAIVMLVLSAPDHKRRFSASTLWIIALLVMAICLFAANRRINGYFGLGEVLLAALWAGTLIALLLDARRLAFAAAAILPGVLLFGAVNPLERGMATITESPLFELVHREPRLLEGKWLVYGDGFPPAIFTAAGCDVYNGMRYIPDLDLLPALERHGVDSRIFRDNLGYVAIAWLKPGEHARADLGEYGPTLSVSPVDPLLKDLGIRYVAFHKHPSDDVLAHLKPLVNGSVSEFWLYELK